MTFRVLCKYLKVGMLDLYLPSFSNNIYAIVQNSYDISPLTQSFYINFITKECFPLGGSFSFTKAITYLLDNEQFMWTSSLFHNQTVVHLIISNNLKQKCLGNFPLLAVLVKKLFFFLNSNTLVYRQIKQTVLFFPKTSKDLYG